MKKINRIFILFFINVLIPILIGGIIYSIWRKDSLLMFDWFDKIEIHPIISFFRDYLGVFQSIIPDFILYSLPDGLWVYSITFCMTLIWKLEFKFNSFFWIFIGLLIAILFEIFQFFDIIQGTYSTLDILACFIGAILAVVISNSLLKIYLTKETTA